MCRRPDDVPASDVSVDRARRPSPPYPTGARSPAYDASMPTVRRSSPVLIATVVGLLVLAVSARLALLRATDLWLDEAASVLMARMSLRELFELLHHESHPPLYYLALHALYALADVGPMAVRWFSVAASVAWIATLLLLRPTALSPAAGCLAASLAALHPLALYYGVEGKMYAALWLCGALVVGALLRGGARAVIAAAVFQALALYLHNFGVLLLPVWLAAWFYERAHRRTVAIACGAAVLAWLPWAVTFLPAQLAVQSAGDNFKVALASESHLSHLLQTVLAVSAVPPFPSYLRTLASLPSTPLAWLGLVLVPAAVIGGHRLWKSGARREVAVLGVAALSACLPLLLVDLLRPVYLPARYELLVLTPLFWLTSASLGGAPQRGRLLTAVRAAPAVVAALVAALVGVQFQRVPEIHRTKGALAELIEERGDSIEVIAVGLTYGALAVASWELDGRARVLPFPAAAATSPGERSPTGYLPHVLDADASQLAVLAPAELDVLLAPTDEPSLLPPLDKALREHGFSPRAPEQAGAYRWIHYRR